MRADTSITWKIWKMIRLGLNIEKPAGCRVRVSSSKKNRIIRTVRAGWVCSRPNGEAHSAGPSRVVRTKRSCTSFNKAL